MDTEAGVQFVTVFFQISGVFGGIFILLGIILIIWDEKRWGYFFSGIGTIILCLVLIILP